MHAAGDTDEKDHNARFVSADDIRLSAYRKWEAAGKPNGDGVQFWLEAEQELLQGNHETLVKRSGWQGQREHDRREAEKLVKASRVSVDSHYRDNNRMFQNHGDRGHRHGGSG
jgi:hypothetical protein